MVRWVGAVVWGLLAGCVTSESEQAGAMLRVLENTKSQKVQSSQAHRFDEMVLRPKQFAQYLVESASGEKRGVRYEVVGSGDMPFSLWFEVEILTANERTVVRLLGLPDESRLAVAQQPGARFEPVLQDYSRFVRARVWSSGETSSQLVEPDMLARVVPGWGELFLLKGLRVAGRDETVVPAGKFKCHKGTSEGDFLGAKGQWKLCLDSQVPLNGIVHAVDAAGGKWSLTRFGVNGSKVDLPDVFP